MNKGNPILFDKQIYYRLIALWVICEAILGGIMHGFKIPFTGIFVSGAAVICISLIAYYVPVKGAILKATIIVAIFKMLLSPQSPPAAYTAVFFQGLMGQILFFNLKYYRVSCILLGMLALVESAVQRILILIIIYGNNFWKAVNDFINKLTHEQTITNYSLLIAFGYIMLHAISGLIIGSFAGSIAWQSQFWRILHEEYVFADDVKQMKIYQTRSHSKTKIRTGFFIIWILLTALFFQSYFHVGKPLLPSYIALQILIRSLLIALTWYFIFSPAILYFMKKWLKKQKAKSQTDITQVMLVLPSTKYIIVRSWQLSAKRKGWKRLTEWCKIIVVNTLQQKKATSEIVDV